MRKNRHAPPVGAYWSPDGARPARRSGWVIALEWLIRGLLVAAAAYVLFQVGVFLAVVVVFVLVVVIGRHAVRSSRW